MSARLPLHALGVTLVAAQTGRIFLACGHGFAGRIPDPPRPSATAGLDVGGGVTMAGRARAGAGRGARIGLRAVFCRLITSYLVGVTIRAHLRAGPRGLCWRSGKS